MQVFALEIINVSESFDFLAPARLQNAKLIVSDPNKVRNTAKNVFLMGVGRKGEKARVIFPNMFVIIIGYIYRRKVN